MGLGLGQLFSKGATALVGAVGKALDDNITNKEEREAAKLALIQEANRASEAIEKEANDLEKAYLSDVASSREANAKIQESHEASWLAKNVAYIFDSTIIVAFLIMLFMVFSKTVPEENKEIFYTGFGLLGALVNQTMGFHRGTSKGSEEKQKMLNRITIQK